MNAKIIAGWIAVALIIWFTIEYPHDTAHVIHNIGTFFASATSGISSFFASI